MRLAITSSRTSRSRSLIACPDTAWPYLPSRGRSPSKQLLPKRRTTPSALQEELDLLEEPLRRRLVLQEQMVLALDGHEPGAGNARCQRAAALEGDHGIAAHVHHERGRGYSG